MRARSTWATSWYLGAVRGLLVQPDSPQPLAELLACSATLRERLAPDLPLALLVAGNAEAGRMAARGAAERAIVLPAGSLVVVLALLHASVLLPTPEDRVLNRNVRGCLRALAAQYFGSEHLVIEGRPIAWVGFDADARGRVQLEFAIAVEQAIATDPPSSMREREFASLRELGRETDRVELARRIVAGHARFGVEFEAPITTLTP